MNSTATSPGEFQGEGVKDPTAFMDWLMASAVAQFLLLHSAEIKYFVMLGYTYVHGCKLFGTKGLFGPETPLSYKFVRMILQCTGGGILVPIFINAIPVSLAVDAYPIAICASFLLHNYFPVIREVMELTPIFKAPMVVLFETMRASVVVKLTTAAAAAIAPSDFAFPVFGPIFCGAVAGCGGAFLPFDKGLAPLEKGLAPNMLTALIAAACFHLFLNTSLSDGVTNAPQKAHLMVAFFFISCGLYLDSGISKIFQSSKISVSKVKKEL